MPVETLQNHGSDAGKATHARLRCAIGIEQPRTTCRSLRMSIHEGNQHLEDIPHQLGVAV